MPSPNTFSIKPIADLLERYITPDLSVVDPFARNSKWAKIYSNDINPDTDANYHMEAVDFCCSLGISSMDVALFDPPYSPRQISECYKQIGIKPTMQHTQNARLGKEVKDELQRVLRVGGIAISAGWNSTGMGINRWFEKEELLLVNHGGAHNDTIVLVERKVKA